MCSPKKVEKVREDNMKTIELRLTEEDKETEEFRCPEKHDKI